MATSNPKRQKMPVSVTIPQEIVASEAVRLWREKDPAAYRASLKADGVIDLDELERTEAVLPGITYRLLAQRLRDIRKAVNIHAPSVRTLLQTADGAWKALANAQRLLGDAMRVLPALPESAPKGEVRVALMEVSDRLGEAESEWNTDADGPVVTKKAFRKAHKTLDNRLCRLAAQFGAAGLGTPTSSTADRAARAETQHPKSRRSRRKTPPQLLKETRERQAVKELAKNPDMTSRQLAKALECNASTVVRLEAWKEKGVLHRDPPRTEIWDTDTDEDADPSGEDLE